jgi:hypothetical protein
MNHRPYRRRHVAVPDAEALRDRAAGRGTARVAGNCPITCHRRSKPVDRPLSVRTSPHIVRASASSSLPSPLLLTSDGAARPWRLITTTRRTP